MKFSAFASALFASLAAAAPNNYGPYNSGPSYNNQGSGSYNNQPSISWNGNQGSGGSNHAGGGFNQGGYGRYRPCPFKIHIYSRVNGVIDKTTQYLSDIGGPVGMDLPDSVHDSTKWEIDSQGRIKASGTNSYLQQIVNKGGNPVPGILGIINQPINRQWSTLRCRITRGGWITCNGGQGTTWQTCAKSGPANARPVDNQASFFYLSNGVRQGYECKQYWMVAEKVYGYCNLPISY